MRTIIALLLLVFAVPAFAQDTAAEERSYFVGYVEDQLSTPNRQIRISGIQGILSSNATIGEITIADREGVWLRITNARIEWTRSALLLGRLDIDRLGADMIEVLRQPLPEEGALPSPEAGPFRLPELPLSIMLDNLDIQRAKFGPEVFGLASELSATGNLTLADGSLQTALDLRRLDGPGGTLELTASFANATGLLNVALDFSEPADGIVANLLNIEGKPPVDLVLSGEGPIDDFDLSLTLDAAGERVLTGATRLDRASGGLGFAAQLEGPIWRLIDPTYRDFFGAETALTANGVVKDAGGVLIEGIDLRSAALSLTASAETGGDGFLTRLTLDASIADDGVEPVILPVPGGETTVRRGRVQADFGNSAGDEWTARVDVQDLTTAAFSAENVDLALVGTAQNIARPAERRITFAVDGGVTGIAAEQTEISEALGSEITLDIDGAWSAGSPVELTRALLSGKALAITAAGAIDDYAYRGDIGVKTQSIAPFSALAGRSLSGALDLEANGEIRPISGAFDLTLDSRASELRIDNAAADNLLGGVTTITGRVARGEEGLTANGLRIANDQIDLGADGIIATDATDFGFDLALADLALVSERAQGRVTASGRATGGQGVVTFTLGAEAASGRLADKRLSDAKMSVEGSFEDGDVNSLVAGSAFLDGVRAEFSAGVALEDGERRLSDLRFTAGGAQVTGNVTQSLSGLLEGGIAVDAADISTAASLFLAEATGAVEAQIELGSADGRQNADIRASIDGVAIDDVRIGQADLTARIEDLFGVPGIDGNLDASQVAAGGVEISQVRGTATRTGETTDFTVDASLANGATVTTAGALSPEDGGYRLRLERAELAQRQLSARLVEPASLLVQGRNVTMDGLTLDVGGGRLTAMGTVAETLDIDVTISELPLAIANAIRPDLGLGGAVTGNAKLSGSRDRPNAAFEIRGRAIGAAALRQAGLSTLEIDATGATTQDRLDIEASVSSPEGFRARVNGAVPLGDGELALDVDLQSFPLATLNTLAPGQELRGNVTGSARVTGAVADPAASFDLRGAGVSAAALAGVGAAPVEVTAAGRFANQTIVLTSANANGPQGLTLSASGRVPLTGSGLQVSANGRVPLSLANRMLAERGTQVSGTVALEVSVSGSIDAPVVNGTLSTSGASVVDPESNLRLNAIALSASLTGQAIAINSLTASVGGGGTVGAAGTISLGAGLPADLRVTLDRVRYADGNLVVATVSGALAVNGPLQRDPVISGEINVERAEITVPSSLGGGAAEIDVVHVDPPPAVAATLRRARADDGTPVPSGRPSVVRLDIRVSAPNRIFVRGRGLDAELGGEVRLTGPITGIQPVGAFDLIRGRLSIIGQRITFDEGTVTLIGDLDPFIDFIARTEGSDITVFITVRGRVSDPRIEFSSQPELPQDEVLARLIFNRGINELSALQIAQLAAAAAELAGGSNTSLLGSLRYATGLDDLDIVTDSEGNAAVRAGRYIQDNIYLGVEAGASGTTRGTINLDITENLKARGSVGSDGDTGLGLFFERDY